MGDIGLKIKKLLQEKNISINDLSKKIDKSTRSLYNYIENKTIIDVETLQKTADVFEVSIGYFFNEETNKEAALIISDVVNYRFNHEIKEKIRGSNLIENLRNNITFDKLSIHNKDLIINIYSDAQTMPLEHFKQKELDILREHGVLNEFFYLIISFIKSNANNIEIYERKKPTK